MVVAWFREIMAHVTKPIALQSRRICVADSSSSTHLSHVGLSVSPSLKRRPFR
jgi:hypothetical protein